MTRSRALVFFLAMAAVVLASMTAGQLVARADSDPHAAAPFAEMAEGPTAPAATEQQLMDVDATVFVTWGLFIVLLLVLTAVYWKPYLRVRGERVTRVEGYREQAAQMEEDTRTRLEKIDRELTEARRQGAGAMAMARAEAHTREQTVLAEAHAKAQAVLADARARLERAMTTQRAALQQRAQELGGDAASRILGRPLS